jgi:hypothetical protein
VSLRSGPDRVPLSTKNFGAFSAVVIVVAILACTLGSPKVYGTLRR